MIKEINIYELRDIVINHYSLKRNDYNHIKGITFNSIVEFFINDYIFNVLKADSFVSTLNSDIIKINYK